MNDTATLVRLADTNLTLADPADDVRGRMVVDTRGDEVGEIDGLVIDDDERRVRLLEVGSGGFLGLGKHKKLVPVESVTGVDDVVHIDADREDVARSPVYNPDLVLDRATTAHFYNYYGYAPYWNAGNINPGLPVRPR
jgi:sporulation protein YlmC with PRC-barrel domain